MKHLKWITLSLFFIPVLTQAQVTLDTLKTVVAAFHAEYDAELATQSARMIVNPAPTPAQANFWWDLEDIRAAYAAMYDKETKILTHYLYILGGYGRLQGMTADGIAETLCHELGHGIGGAPYKAYEHEETNVTVEAQADYFAYRHCLPRIFKRLHPSAAAKPVNAYTDSLCKQLPKDKYLFCTRAFQTLEVSRLFFKLNPDDPDTDFAKQDPSVATAINTDPYFYPSSQCRIDTMMAGLFEKDRPKCWFRP